MTLINPVSAAANEQADTPKLTVHLPSVQEQYPDGATTDRIRRTVLAALRHSPEHFGLRMDVEGWVDLLEVGHLINSFAIGTQFTNRESVRLALQHLGLGDRLLFSLDYCRAAYGHSTPSFSPRVTATPDSCLYHGTSAEALRMIDCFGLQPMKRRFVQLTTDCNYANQIAQNASSSPVVLEIACKPAIECGVQFFPTGSHVWLSTAIPSDCLHVWLSSSSALSNRDSLRNR